jgi:phage gpG-like protein
MAWRKVRVGVDISDQISPALYRALERMQDRRPALAAAGGALESVATRAFRDAELRPAEWPPLAESTQRRRPGGQPLIDTGALLRSLAAKEPTQERVEVASSREYALFHQFGTKHMPARPFFPVDAGGKLTERAGLEVQAVLEAAIREAFGTASLPH